MIPMRRAILSVSDKSGLVEFARGLAARGFELVSTGGTARTLTDAGFPVINVSDVTGFPEMMDGRVKTLHPKIHGGILARRAHGEDLAAAAMHGIALVDLVCVNLYPFVATAAKPDVGFDELVEQIDIGGPSLVRAAAKNFRDVLVVVSPADYATVLDALDGAGGPTAALRFELARRAFAHTGAYDMAIASTLDDVRIENEVVQTRCCACSVSSAAAHYRGAQTSRPALRREPPSAGRMVRGRSRGRSWRRIHASGQRAVVHQPP